MPDSIPRHSLARIRHFQPTPPFWAGGEYLRMAGASYLKDAEEAVRLDGPAELFEGFQNGDLVQFEVVKTGDEILYVTRALHVHAAQGERGRPRPHAPEFAKFHSQVRAYLESRGMKEIFTPTLVTCPGLEPSLEAFETKVTKGKETWTKYLPTSPEIHLKKALAQGWTDIFEIRPCFRRGEFSEHHANEFHMLEWYRAFADLDLIIEDLRGLLKTLKAETLPRVTDFKALFNEVLAFDLKPGTTREDLASLARSLSIDTVESDTFSDIFHRLMIARIEPAMVKMGPLIVRRFPPSMAALAKIERDGWADRFEFYWNGLEIANAFNEVIDPDEQFKRWQGEIQERKRLGTGDLPMDLEMIESLKAGVPPTGGIALGMERLYMALFAVTDIRELTLFSL